MQFPKTLINAEERHKRILEFIMALYIVFNIDTPMQLAKLVDSPMGIVVVVLLALSMFAAAGPVAGILALVAAHTLIKRSSKETGSYYIQGSGNAEEIKAEMLEKYNSFPKTLEEDVIDKMAPLVGPNANSKLDYKPLLDPLHDAAPINYEGVI